MDFLCLEWFGNTKFGRESASVGDRLRTDSPARAKTAGVGANGLVTTSTFETRAQADDSVGMAARWGRGKRFIVRRGSPRVTSGENRRSPRGRKRESGLRRDAPIYRETYRRG